MGTVYVVYDREWSEPFAVKTFRDDVFRQNPRIADRFVDEARAWTNLDDHENIVRARFVQQIGGKPFLFLEYVSGGDLSAWIDNRRLQNDVPLALRFAIQFCDGMVYANSKGIEVHRDIKPQNCLVTEGGVLKVTDFGLARALDSSADAVMPTTAPSPQPIDLTGTGTAIGTCTHMAPEQFDDAKRVDARADIYSFGITFFQMLTGNLPFQANSWVEYALLHKQQPMPQLRAIDGGINMILQRCGAKDPSQRYENFVTLRHELKRAFERLTGLPAPMPKAGRELDAYSLVNKGVSLKRLGRIDEAILCYDKALTLEQAIPEAWANKGSALAALGQQRDAIRCFDLCLAISPKLQTAWLNKAKSLKVLGENEKAVDCCEAAIALDQSSHEAWYCKAVALSKIGRTQEAISSFERSVLLNPGEADYWYNLGASQAKFRAYNKAISCYEKATRLDLGFAAAWFNKAHAHQFLKEFEESVDACERFIALKPTDADAWMLKGAALEDLHRYREAIVSFQRAEQLGHLRAREGIANCQSHL